MSQNNNCFCVFCFPVLTIKGGFVNTKIEDKTIRAVLVLNERTTEVKRGENRHRTLKNTNIVVAEKYLNDVKPKGFGSIEIPNLVGKNEALTLMLLVENEKVDITSAAKVAIY